MRQESCQLRHSKRLPFLTRISYCLAVRRSESKGIVVALLLLALLPAGLAQQNPERPRARDLGLIVGELPTGPLNAITDVGGVRVGHATLVRGENIRTGVTAVLPHGGNLFRDKVPGAVFIGNAFGKLPDPRRSTNWARSKHRSC